MAYFNTKGLERLFKEEQRTFTSSKASVRNSWMNRQVPNLYCQDFSNFSGSHSNCCCFFWRKGYGTPLFHCNRLSNRRASKACNSMDCSSPACHNNRACNSPWSRRNSCRECKWWWFRLSRRHYSIHIHSAWLQMKSLKNGSKVNVTWSVFHWYRQAPPCPDWFNGIGGIHCCRLTAFLQDLRLVFFQ